MPRRLLTPVEEWLYESWRRRIRAVVQGIVREWDHVQVQLDVDRAVPALIVSVTRGDLPSLIGHGGAHIRAIQALTQAWVGRHGLPLAVIVNKPTNNRGQEMAG